MNTISGYLSECSLFTQVINSGDDVLHDHTFVEVFFIIEGAAHHVCNGTSTELIRGSIGFLRPKDQHMYIRNSGTPCVHRDILISVPRFKEFCDMLDPQLFDYFMNSSHPFLFQLMPETLSRFEKLFNSFSAHPNAVIGGTILSKESLLISEVINVWIDHIISEKKDAPTWFTTLQNKLSNPKYFCYTLSEIINLSNTCYDRATLSRMFKKYAGCSMISYFLASKINYSVSLLTFTDMPITEIASLSGFSTVTYFNKLFKQSLGITPSQYRKNTKQGDASKKTIRYYN